MWRHTWEWNVLGSVKEKPISNRTRILSFPPRPLMGYGTHVRDSWSVPASAQNVSFSFLQFFWLLFILHKISLSITSFRKLSLNCGFDLERSLGAHGVPCAEPDSCLYHPAPSLGFDSFHPLAQTINFMKIRILPTSFSSPLRKLCFCSGLCLSCIQSTWLKGGHFFPISRNGSDYLSQWFSARGVCSPGNFWQCQDTHVVVTAGVSCGHSVGRGWRCC